MTLTVQMRDGRELVVDAEFVPGDGDGWNTPVVAASFEIEAVWESGQPIDTTAEEEVEINAALWHQRLLDIEDEIASRNDAIEARRIV